jgi:hypothetical protein
VVVVAGSIINEVAIKVKSQELQIPFANIAAAFVLEEFLQNVKESEYKNCLWLKNAGSLGLERYRRKLVLNLDFYYRADSSIKPEAGNVPGQVMSKEWLDVMFAHLCQEDKKKSLTWSYEISKEAEVFRILLTATIGSMQVPITIRIENLTNEKAMPYEATIRLSMRNNDQISLLQYPMEYITADCMSEILEKLELINDMSVYQKLYTILTREPLDGRKIQQQLTLKCQEKNISIDQKRMDILLTYHDYTYMKKKWKKYLKSENKATPSWEEVTDAVNAMFVPVWKIMMEDIIFLGAWMPELLRYLD